MNLYTHTFHSIHRIVYDHCEDSRHLRMIHYHKNTDKAILYVHMIFLFRIIQSTFQKSCLSYEFFANDSPPLILFRFFCITLLLTLICVFLRLRISFSRAADIDHIAVTQVTISTKLIGNQIHIFKLTDIVRR